MFKNRFQAGIKLAESLKQEGLDKDLKILSFSNKGKIISNAIKTMINCQTYLLKDDQQEIEISKKDKVVLVDDGQISLSLIQTIIKYLRKVNPRQIAIAIPVFDKDKSNQLKQIADKVIILHQPDIFMGVSDFYQEDKISPEYQLKVLK